MNLQWTVMGHLRSMVAYLNISTLQLANDKSSTDTFSCKFGEQYRTNSFGINVIVIEALFEKLLIMAKKRAFPR